VIPGSVDDNRRDYEPVLAVFQSWKGPAIQLVLLGDASSDFGRSLVSRLRSLPALTVRQYEGYIPETLYEREIREADLLWSPLRIHKTGSRDNPEIYGQTTASGLTADILLNNIPALAPAELVLPGPFTAALLPYRDAAEAAELLRRLMTDDAWRGRLRQDIHEAFGYMKAGNFVSAFERLSAPDEGGEERSTNAVEAVYPNLQ
jgi:hypothetical protein